MENIRLQDLKQKAKVKWATHGDENSKFFHGGLNNKLMWSRINGNSKNSLQVIKDLASNFTRTNSKKN